jgi:CCR4-NOT transcriptional complex subunit CAF120
MTEFAPVVELIGMQPQKTYVASPPELEMILARTSAGGQPKQGQPGSASNDWDAVWLQLSGISLCESSATGDVHSHELQLISQQCGR